jgi:CheY-like chemotaxis protein
MATPAMRGALRYLVSLCLPAAHIVELAEGAQVLERTQTLRPDLVLMDVVGLLVNYFKINSL